MSDLGYANISGDYPLVFAGGGKRRQCPGLPRVRGDPGLSGRQCAQGQTGCFQMFLGPPKPELFLQFCGLRELAFC